MELPFRSNSGGIKWDYQVDISFGSKRPGIRTKAEVSFRTIRWDYHLEEIVEVLGGTIRWDYHLERIAEGSCGTIKWTYHFEVKDWVSGGTIWWGYLLEVKQKYQVELSGRSTIWKQWQRY